MTSLKEIIEQLKLCRFDCEGGALENNIAFIELKKLAIPQPGQQPVSIVQDEDGYIEKRPVQASQDSNLNEQFPFPLDAKDAKDAKYWLTKEQWTDIMYSVVGISPYQSKDPDDMTDYPIPDGEAILKTIRINQKMTNCEQAVRKDERERAIHPPFGDDYCLSCKRDPLVENYCKTCNIPRSDPKELRKQGKP